MRQPGLPGLALVLALTMVLGFAATASASYFGNYIKYDFFAAGGAADYTVGGDNYYVDMDVDGNKEYTIKAKFDEGDIAPFFGNIDETYDMLYKEYRVLEAIESYTANDFLGTADWNTASGDANNIFSTHGNPLYEAVADIYPTVTDSTLYDALIDAVAAHASSTTPFKDGYKDAEFQSVKKATERAWNTYYSNGYYGYDKGIVATATSKDTTYATITSQPTVDVSRTVGGTTEYEVSFKVRFTNTTFRKADVDIEVVFNAGGAVQQAYYEHKDTLSFTVFQAQYRTFTEQAGCPRWQVAHKGGEEIKRWMPAMRRGEESGGRTTYSAGIQRIQYRGEQDARPAVYLPLSPHEIKKPALGRRLHHISPRASGG